MKVVILAGGLGTRLSEETQLRPKPMVDIGEHPMLWHIMKIYGHHGFNEFFVTLGYKGEWIKRYFVEYASLSGDLTVQLDGRGVRVHEGKPREDWTVHLIDTGVQTNTGGRLKRLESHLSDGTFMLTYGDGVAPIRLHDLLAFHKSHGRLATVTAVRPPARFGGLIFKGDAVTEFQEKPQIGEGWINGGFMVFEPGVFRYLAGDGDSLEADMLTRLAADGQLMAWRHGEFWQCMDTLRELRLLEQLWASGAAPWKLW